MEYEIRLAAPTDEEALVGLLREMHSESGFGEFSEAQARLAIEVGLRREMAMVGVIRGKFGIEGSVGLFLQHPPFSQSAVLGDLWLFVQENYRKSARMKSLIEFAKWAAAELDKPLLITAISNERTQRKVELFERQLPRAGSVFCYRPEGLTAA